MVCVHCGGATTEARADHPYREGGMGHVVLEDLARRECARCGDRRVEIPGIGALHGFLSREIAKKPARLIPSEVRFVRDHLALSNEGFAALMGVTPGQASRWTTTTPIGIPAERFLRLLAAIGPGALATGPMDGDRVLDDVRSTLAGLPSRSEPAKELILRVRWDGARWQRRS
jgi:YgiT-type zinc finger domain-containing protein